MLSDINLSFERLSPSMRQVGYVLLTRAPVASFGLQANQTDAPRLACVKPVASVHPEPGSNSLKNCINSNLSARFNHSSK